MAMLEFYSLLRITMFDKLKKGLTDMVWEDSKPKTVPDSKAAKAPESVLPMSAGEAFDPSVMGTAPSVSGDAVLDLEKIQSTINSSITGSNEFAQAASFLNTVDSLKNVPGLSDEGTRYKAALATTATQGVTLASLLTAVKSYSAVLTNATTDFEQSVVVAANDEVNRMNAQAEALQEQIQTLATQLGQLNAQRSELVAAASKKAADIAKAGIDFNSITKTIDTQYQEITRKLQQYLGA